MAQRKKANIKHEKEILLSDQLYEEAISLFHRIENEFEDVKGPPRITLSVARGIDDHKYHELDRLAATQKHHLHWKNVSDEEISYYHDCWSFMDAEAFYFYIPAFMFHYLFKEIFDQEDRVLSLSEPFWLILIGTATVEIDLLNEPQKDIITDFFELIYRYTDNECEKKFFMKNTIIPWKTRSKISEPKY